MIKRNTFQRSLVMEAVQKLGVRDTGHATAEEIYETVREICPSISRTTVYRNLQQLCEAGTIRRIEVPGGADRYDHVTTGHYHFKCSVCGRVSDVDMDYLPDLALKIRDTHGYRIEEHSIIFTGICPDCLQTTPAT